MRPRQPPPRLLLMTDERMGEGLWAALAWLPRGSGVVVRHRATPPAERRALFEAVRAVARRRGLVLLLSGSPREAVGWRADGAHGPAAQRRAARPLLRSAPAHRARELIAARRHRLDLVLLSPVFPTRSHPGAATLGPVRFGLLARTAGPVGVIALGGMDDRRFRRLAQFHAMGWAGIDGLVGPPGRGQRG